MGQPSHLGNFLKIFAKLPLGKLGESFEEIHFLQILVEISYNSQV